MKPDYEVIAQAPGASGRALSEPGRQYAIYLKNGNQCNLKLNLPKGRYHYEWISTLDGSFLRTGELKCRSGLTILESPAYRDDIALKIVRK